MPKFHLTAGGDPAPCTATVRECPLGGEAEHGEFASVEEARTWAEAKLAEEYSSFAAHEQDLKNRLGEQGLKYRVVEPTMQDGQPVYSLPPGEYYLYLDEDGWINDEVEGAELLSDFLYAPSAAADLRVGSINGEPVYSDQENWSGVTWTLMSARAAQHLRKLGLNRPKEEITISEPLTLSKAEDSPDNENYLRPRVQNTKSVLSLSQDYELMVQAWED